MSTNAAPISHTAYRRIGVVSSKQLGIVSARRSVNFDDMLRSNWIGLSTAMIDTKLVPKLDMPNLPLRQDYAYWLLLTKLGFDSYGLDEPLVDYYVRKKSISANKIRAGLNHARVLIRYGRPSFLALPYLLTFYLLQASLKRL